MFFAYSIFLWAALRLISVTYPTPDMCVAARAIFFAAGLFRNILKRDGGLPRYALLELLSVCGYLAKSAMLPIGLALLDYVCMSLAVNRGIRC